MQMAKFLDNAPVGNPKHLGFLGNQPFYMEHEKKTIFFASLNTNQGNVYVRFKFDV